MELKEVLFKEHTVSKYQGGIFLLPLLFFEQADELRHYEVSSLLQRTGPEEAATWRSGVFLPPFPVPLLLPGVWERSW